MRPASDTMADDGCKLRLGVDVGGTHTDAVLMDADGQIIVWDKALTTHENHADGVMAAIEAILGPDGVRAPGVALVALSTTLATNAIVERRGDPVALVSLGFSGRDLGRTELTEALAGDPVIRLAGGHDHQGLELAPLAMDDLDRWLTQQGSDASVSAFAVAGRFAIRNPDHEIRVRDRIRGLTGRPATCSHELSARLNGPRRAVTAVLNARLIGLVDRLIGTIETRLSQRGITAPLMVVRGDGALVSAAVARGKPVETILSGPAASVIAANRLTGETEAVVADMGGTTTDVAVLRKGRPALDTDGAHVGGFRTMVEAVAVRTVGLGGDSEARLLTEGMANLLCLGPRRAIPVSLLATERPKAVHGALDRQSAKEQPGEFDAQLVFKTRRRPDRNRPAPALAAREAELFERLGSEVCELGAVVRNRKELAILDRLIGRGLVSLAGVTPSDAAHVLGMQECWDRGAAVKALGLLARKRDTAGVAFAGSAAAAARRVVDQLVWQSVGHLMVSAFAWDGHDFGDSPEALAGHGLTVAGLSQYRGLVQLDVGLNAPLVALGAPAALYFDAIGGTLSATVRRPGLAPVAGAVGAAGARIAMRARGQITCPSPGQYLLHSAAGMSVADSEEQALAQLETALREEAQRKARDAGATATVLNTERTIRRTPESGGAVLLQADVSVEAVGRPSGRSR